MEEAPPFVGLPIALQQVQRGRVDVALRGNRLPGAAVRTRLFRRLEHNADDVAALLLIDGILPFDLSWQFNEGGPKSLGSVKRFQEALTLCWSIYQAWESDTNQGKDPMVVAKQILDGKIACSGNPREMFDAILTEGYYHCVQHMTSGIGGAHES